MKRNFKKKEIRTQNNSSGWGGGGEVTEGRSYLEAGHLGGALGENDSGQQEEEGVGHQAVHRLPIQEQAGVDGLHQGLGLPARDPD